MVEDELRPYKQNGYKVEMMRPTNNLIRKLIKYNKVISFSRDYYDSEPNMPMDWYKRIEVGEDIWTDLNIKSMWTDLCKNYEDERLSFSTSVELYRKGIWGSTQADVERMSKLYLRRLARVKCKHRLYLISKDDELILFYYGRDIALCDMWWKFNHRRKKKKTKLRKKG